VTSPRQPHILVGLLGAGIGSSHSPLLHEQEADRRGIRLHYTTVDSDTHGLTADDLPGLLRWARALGYRGLNVTYPFKQQIVRHLDQLSAQARTLRAVNTVVFTDDGTCGYNTDAVGFARHFDHNFSGAPRNEVVQLGAGGAGSAVAHAMLTLGAGRLTLVDVDTTKAVQLAGLLGDEFDGDRIAVGSPAELTALLAGADGLINTTPVGMAHHPGCPVPAGVLRPDLWVADIVYRPTDTALLRAARAAGARTLPGTGMSVYQAVAAFEHFTGIPADPGAMLADSEELLRNGH
jgi:shikimate dehydrogenase